MNEKTRDILLRNEHRNRLSRLLFTPSFLSTMRPRIVHRITRAETAPVFIQPVCLPVTILRQSRFHKRCVLYVDPGHVCGGPVRGSWSRNIRAHPFESSTGKCITLV